MRNVISAREVQSRFLPLDIVDLQAGIFWWVRECRCGASLPSVPHLSYFTTSNCKGREIMSLWVVYPWKYTL